MDNRDTQFAGFAKLVSDEIRNDDVIPDSRSSQELWTRIQSIIARRAYDLVLHSVREVDPFLLESKYTEDEQIMNQIPDLTTWPEETKQ